MIILREIHFLNLDLLYNQNLEENFFSMSESYFIPSQFIKESIEPNISIVDDFKSYISMSFVKHILLYVNYLETY